MKESQKIVWRETAVVLIGEIACVALMYGVYALLGKLQGAVLRGGIAGVLLAVANFFFMAVGASLAADKAADQDVKGGKSILQASMLLRYVVLFVVLFALVRSGLCDALALVLPILFVRPVMTVGEFFRRSGDKQR